MKLLPGVVFPSSPAMQDALSAGLSFLPRYKLFLAKEAEFSFLAGSDASRTSSICQALVDPEVDVLLAARGGHGALRLDRKRIFEHLRQFPKPIVGFSDITALHFLWSQAGVPSFFGPNVTQLPMLASQHCHRFLTLLDGQLDAMKISLTCLTNCFDRPICAPLCGANLTVAVCTVGTPWSFSWNGKIVVLEEIRESAYRLDRMLWQLFHATDLSEAAALVLGEFTECSGFQINWLVKACQTWAPRLPVFAGFPGGHGQSNVVFRFGGEAHLNGSGELFLRPYFWDYAL